MPEQRRSMRASVQISVQHRPSAANFDGLGRKNGSFLRGGRLVAPVVQHGDNRSAPAGSMSACSSVRPRLGGVRATLAGGVRVKPKSCISFSAACRGSGTGRCQVVASPLSNSRIRSASYWGGFCHGTSLPPRTLILDSLIQAQIPPLFRALHQSTPKWELWCFLPCA